MRPITPGHLAACHRAEELPPLAAAAPPEPAPAAARRLALYAERRARSETAG